MPLNEMEDRENKMFSQRLKSLMPEDQSQPWHCCLWAECGFALISVLLHKIPETHTSMLGRGKGKHQDILLLAKTLPPNRIVELWHLGWSQWKAVFQRWEPKANNLFFPYLMKILDLNIDGKERKIQRKRSEKGRKFKSIRHLSSV